MSLLDKPLSPENLRFLQEEYRLYTPGLGCDSDFGVLQGRKVYLIGEGHETGELIASQDAFFQRFATVKDCLLLEGLHPGETFSSASLSFWPNLPSMRVIGSDVRSKKEGGGQLLADYLSIQNRGVKKAQNMGKVDELTRKAILLINGEMRNGRSFRCNGYLLLAPEVMGKIHEIWKEVDVLFQEVVALYKDMRQSTEKSSLRMEDSNEGLAKTIIQASKDPTIDKVYARWGLGHYLCGRKFFRILNAERVSYCVLLPKYQKLKAVDRGLGLNDVSHLNVAHPSFENGKIYRLPFHPSLEPLFSAAIRPLLTLTISNPKIWITPEWLQSNSRLTTKPNETLCFPVNLSEEEVDRWMTGIPPMSIKDAFAQFEPLYLAAKKRILFEGKDINFEHHYDLKKGSSSIKLESKNPITITTRDLIVTSPLALWQYMVEQHIQIFTIPPKTMFAFAGVQGDFSNIMSLLDQILSSGVPGGMRSRIAGSIHIRPCKLDSEESNGISINSEKEFEIHLESATP